METTSFSQRPPPLRLRTGPDDLDSTRCTRCFEPHALHDSCVRFQRVPPSLPLQPAIPSSDFSSYTALIWPSTASSSSSSTTSSSPRSTSSLHTSWRGDSDSETQYSTTSSSTPTTSPIAKVRVSKHHRDALRNASPPILRRKISPTETSLRDIRASQQRLLRVKESEDQLRRLYERQTMEYLGGGFASLDTLCG